MLSIRIYRRMLCCYPAPFRDEYGAAMIQAFAEQVRAAREYGGCRAVSSVCFETLIDLFLTAPWEHYQLIRQDVRYALRTLKSQRGFSLVAILSLAIGIGANTAIFSLLNSVLISSLPVPDPGQVVMLTDPAASGVSQGLQRNERSLLTYAEFLELRDRSTVFTSLMACQSELDRLNVRVEGGAPEEIRTRLVSAEYFSTLGVPAVLGRTFDSHDDPSSPNAVISYAYWERRFHRRADVLGMKMTVRQGIFTIIGVTPPSFFGETVGERPDAWLPLTLQPLVLPGRDWLHDQSADLAKVMWLHSFGRLKPGTPLEKAQAAINVVFQQGLQTYYGAVTTPETRKAFLNQRLRLREAGKGASQVRGQFAEPLTMLLIAAGLVLLIACANLGNLLLARTNARTREISVRLALGATRKQLVRQLFTESIVIAVLGGVAGVAVAWLLREGLVQLVSNSVQLPAGADLRVLGFVFGITLAVGVILGLFPTLRVLGVSAAAGLQEQGRGFTGSAASVRAGRFVVVAQLALSLPLLVGAGLLLQTLHNLRRVDLGYAKEQLVIVEVDAQTAGYEPARRPALFQQLLERIRSSPGVRAAAYSNNGLFSDSDSGDQVLVEGYTPDTEKHRTSRYDHVGPNYFSALGIPLLAGREITERDQSSTAKVCVINKAFAQVFFAGRNPVGMHLTEVYADQRNTFEVIGVARDSRGNHLRGEIEPRYYVPAAQPIFPLDTVSFAIRTVAEPGSVIAGVRRAIRAVDPNLPINIARPLTEIVNDRMEQDLLLARLSIVFGIVAVLLSALGLYGVLAYGVARRTNELGIRKALGALPRVVVVMILRETGWLLLAGLCTGAILSVAVMRLIASRLYGLAPTDPIAFAGAAGVLIIVGLLATAIPAYQASRVDPLIALRYE